ncbi:MAG: 3'-5' exonuclease [Porphyromonas sp.]|nr:3'-5' exonuclease [Porphyromonas sp.]
MFFLIIVALVVLFVVWKVLREQYYGADDSVGYEEEVAPSYGIEPYKLERSSTPTKACYAFIDFQTTGLSVVEGDEDRILEASWLVVDEQMLEIRRGLQLVRQPTLGSLEARRVHGITQERIDQFGVDELEMLDELWSSVADVPYWVFHNASFDLAILLGTVRRLRPELEEPILSHPCICTMKYLSLTTESGAPYLGLVTLAHDLTGIPWSELTRVDMKSWRNVCLTRLCLFVLLKEYPSRAGDKGDLPAELFLE